MMAKRYYNKTAFVMNDESAPANLPQEKKMGMFPECPYGGDGYMYGDTLESADRQMKEDIKFFNRKNKIGKW